MTGPKGTDGDDEQPFTSSDDEREPDWVGQIRELRKQRGPRLEERLADEDEDGKRPLPDL